MSAQQTVLSFDICRNRHRGAANSEKANSRVDKATDRVRLYQLMVQMGDHGVTLKEACVAMGKEKNEISGRFAELFHTYKACRREGEREGCAVHIAHFAEIQ